MGQNKQQMFEENLLWKKLAKLKLKSSLQKIQCQWKTFWTETIKTCNEQLSLWLSDFGRISFFSNNAAAVLSIITKPCWDNFLFVNLWKIVVRRWTNWDRNFIQQFF